MQAKAVINKPRDECEQLAAQVISMPESQERQADTSAGGAARAAAAPPVVTAAVQHTGTQLEPGVRREFEHRLGHDFSAVRIHSDGEATRAAAAVDAGAYTLGRHIVIREGLYDPSTLEGHRLLAHELTHVVQQAAFQDHKLVGAPVLGADHPSERQARAGNGAATLLAAPAVQRAPLVDIVKSEQHITIDLSAKTWRSVTFEGGQSQVVYVLRDIATGEVLKVGKTTVSSLEGRFGEYVSAGNKWGRKLAADVYTLRKRPGRTVQVFEKEIRAGLENMGHRLPWDNTDGRLGRKGKGIPAPKPISEGGSDLEFIDEVEKGLHDPPAATGTHGSTPGLPRRPARPPIPKSAPKPVTPPAHEAEGTTPTPKAKPAEPAAGAAESASAESAVPQPKVPVRQAGPAAGAARPAAASLAEPLAEQLGEQQRFLRRAITVTRVLKVGLVVLEVIGELDTAFSMINIAQKQARGEASLLDKELKRAEYLAGEATTMQQEYEAYSKQLTAWKWELLPLLSPPRGRVLAAAHDTRSLLGDQDSLIGKLDERIGRLAKLQKVTEARERFAKKSLESGLVGAGATAATIFAASQDLEKINGALSGAMSALTAERAAAAADKPFLLEYVRDCNDWIARYDQQHGGTQ